MGHDQMTTPTQAREAIRASAAHTQWVNPVAICDKAIAALVSSGAAYGDAAKAVRAEWKAHFEVMGFF